MKVIEMLVDVWDNNLATPSSLSAEEIQEFKKRTNANRVMARNWIYDGKPYETHHQIRLLKDHSGFIYYQNDDPRSRHLVVVNGDGTQRFVIGVPCLNENSRPSNGYLSLPPSPARFGGIEWGVEGNDGNTDYLFDFDWDTGKLLRYARLTHSW